MVTGPCHDGGLTAPGVVQVRGGIAEPRPEVQHHARRLPGDARVSIGGTGRDALEQREDRPHGLGAGERVHHGHLRRPGIGEADVDSSCAAG